MYKILSPFISKRCWFFPSNDRIVIHNWSNGSYEFILICNQMLQTSGGIVRTGFIDISQMLFLTFREYSTHVLNAFLNNKKIRLTRNNVWYFLFHLFQTCHQFNDHQCRVLSSVVSCNHLWHANVIGLFTFEDHFISQSNE